ncbi:cytochrome P450 [Actinomadura litoris]|uniref:Cytochrome P450 n=1 Tax=Actinomadura litoris TaxID=2678616 RepID=A0A7K1L5U1_9ACTN|nr:cytochrome P450 [Actinomadura litoris]MUN39626.1 cytochrome P450 [Actinomadura litoris]
MAAPRSIPTVPGSLPLIGHMAALLRDPLGFLRTLPAHGDLVRLRLGPVDAVLVCDPDLILQVLRDDRTFDKGGPVFARLGEAVGDGLATCPHSRHRRQRRLVQPAFHPGRLPGYAEVMTGRIDAVTGSWRDGQILDVLPEMMTISVETTTAMIYSDALPGPVRRATLEDIGTVLAGAFRRMLTPPPLDRLPTPANRRYHRAIADLRATLGGVVDDRRGDDADRGDLLSALLASRDPGGGRGLTDEEIVDQAMTFLIAGTETTAAVLAWTMHLMAGHPDIEDRLHAEVDDVLGDRPATHAVLPELGMTGQIISETLRLLPPAWLFTRTATADTRLGLAGIPKGTTMLCSPYVIHHRADLYPHPERFDPDRWSPERRTALPRGGFLPFGAGARKCIGDRFGLTEATLALATIAARWRLEPLPGQDDARVALAATLRPRELRMRAAARTARPESRPPGRRA